MREPGVINVAGVVATLNVALPKARNNDGGRERKDAGPAFAQKLASAVQGQRCGKFRRALVRYGFLHSRDCTASRIFQIPIEAESINIITRNTALPCNIR